MRKLPLLLRLELERVAGSGAVIAFAVFVLLPTLIFMYIGLLFWAPLSRQAIEVLQLIRPGIDVYHSLFSDYVDAVKSLTGLVLGFWAGFPMLVMVSIVIAVLISGERASGTFELLVTRPVARWELVLSRVLSFIFLSLVILLVANTLNIATIALSLYNGLGLRVVVRALQDAWKYIAYYTAASWLYVLAVTSLSLVVAIYSRRTFLPVLAVLGYYISITALPGFANAVAHGPIARRITELFKYLDISRYTSTILYRWVYGPAARMTESGIAVSYSAAFAIVLGLSLTLITLSLILVEKIDLS